MLSELTSHKELRENITSIGGILNRFENNTIFFFYTMYHFYNQKKVKLLLANVILTLKKKNKNQKTPYLIPLINHTENEGACFNLILLY